LPTSFRLIDILFLRVPGLLVKHILDQERRLPDGSSKLVFFLVNLVPLVFQQSDVLRRHCDQHVKSYCGEMDVDSWNGATWKKNLGEAQIHVMTAAIFLNIVSCGFVQMKHIALLILDECHHAKRKHPYAVIFDNYYRMVPPEARPKVFGMTASPIVGKQEIQSGLSQLRNAINCQIITCEESEIANFVPRAKEHTVWYPALPESATFPLYQRFLEAGDLAVQAEMVETPSEHKKPFTKVVNGTREITRQLGTAAGDYYLRELLPELNRWTRRQYAKEKVRNPFLESIVQQMRPHALEATPPERLANSLKVKRLIAELTAYQQKPEYCAIIFVERRSMAWALGTILKEKFGSSVGTIIGHGSAGFEDNSVGQQMDYKVQNGGLLNSGVDI
jgi:endoribonuclease Dicer